jgi:hypothetical protein
MQTKRLLTLSGLTTLVATVLVALLLVMAPAGAAQDATTETGQFTAILKGAQEVPPVATAASGMARFTLTNDDKLTYEVAVQNITGITAAHIHPGAPGVNGPPLFTLFDGTDTFDPGNPISGEVTLTNAQVTALLAGNYYINVHTSANPGGEIRGQIVAAQTMAFGAFLSAADEVPPNGSGATGQAFATLSADMTQLHFRVLVADIGMVTAAHFHEAPVGVNGPVIIPIYTGGPPPFDEDNPAGGTVTPTIGQIAAIMAGNVYVNVHTATLPGGEIRGQVESMTPRLNYHALLTGDEENPPVDTEAAGVGKFTLSADLSELDYHVAVADITDITAAHLHLGWPGQNGGVVHTLYNGTGDFDPDNPIDGTLTLNAQHVLDLWTGIYYANVHTTAHPGGEIRGQVEGPSLFHANLDGAQENPPINTAATGRTVLALSDDATTLFYRVMVSDIEHITAAHIHLGPVGVNGGIVFTLFDGTGTFDPDNPISGSVTLTDANVLDLVGGDYYVNVHTQHAPGGEIRGQIWPFDAPDYYRSWLTGDEEVPPVATEATGLARYTLDEGRNTLHFRVDVADIDNVTAAHIHKAPFGVNGPVIFPLFLGVGTFDPTHPIGGGGMPGAEGLVDLLTGFYYTNVHTTDYPGGEIRGQITPAATVYLPVIVP